MERVTSEESLLEGAEREIADQGKTKVTVNIYGEEYVIKGQTDPAVIEKIAAYVDRKMRLVGQKKPTTAFEQSGCMGCSEHCRGSGQIT